MFVTIGAWDFSPEIKVRLIGTEVPCTANVPLHKFRTIGQ